MPVNTYNHIFTKGPESALPATFDEGKIRYTVDTGRLFVDGQNNRTEISDFVKGMTEAEIKAQLAPLASKIYISSDTNKFLIYDGTAVDPWINIANSGQADYATNAGTSVYATNAGTATEANHAASATNASTSTYATNAGTSTYATNSGTATYGTNAGTAVHASTADYATNASTSAYASNAGTAVHVTNGVKSITSGTTNGSVNVNVNGTTSDVAVKGLKALAYKDSLGSSDVGLGNVANINQSKAIKSITRSGTTFTATALDGTTSSFTQQDNNTTYAAGAGIALNSGTFSNSGVRAAATGTTNGTININTNGSTANIAVKGLAALAYKASLSKSDVGLSNVANLDQSKAIKSITRSGTTFTATAIDGTTSSFTQQDNNTTYAAGAGIALNSGTFSNSGVRSVATGTTAGTISVNTNGSTADVEVKDAGKAVKSITRSGTTFTATAIDGSTFSFTQQDNNTKYAAGAGIALNSGTFSNSGVRAIAEGGTNGTINVNTNGSTANVAVHGLGALAYKASLSKSDVGLGNVANLDQSKAIKSITRSGTTFTATAIDGSTSSFTQQDNNTTYTGTNGISLSGTTFSNSGVRSIATGGTNGTINVNTNGGTANVAVKGLGSNAYTSTSYLPTAGGTMTGCLILETIGEDNYREGIRINTSDNGWASLIIGGSNGSTSSPQDGSFWIGTHATSAADFRKLFIGHNSSSHKTFFYAYSDQDHSPSLQLGGELKIGGDDGPTMKYNNATQSIDFIFA